MRLCAVSDLHGNLPEVPDCDVIVIAGDVVVGPEQRAGQWQNFGDWLVDLVKRGIIPIGVAGNHDFALRDRAFAERLPWLYLEDSAAVVGGLSFWGSPWQEWLGGWAFNAPEEDEGEAFLRQKFERIPNVDVLITHSPPAGFFDTVGKRHTGSIALNERVEQIQPKLHVFGHIHKQGVEQIGTTTLCNASISTVRNKRYVPTNKPIIFDL